MIVKYHERDYRVELGPPYFVEQRNGALLGSGLPSISLVDVETDARYGLTFEIPEAPIKPGQVLVGGREEGLRALTDAGVVRHTGEYYRSSEYGATLAVCDFLGEPQQQISKRLQKLFSEWREDAQLAKERDETGREPASQAEQASAVEKLRHAGKRAARQPKGRGKGMER